MPTCSKCFRSFAIIQSPIYFQTPHRSLLGLFAIFLLYTITNHSSVFVQHSLCWFQDHSHLRIEFACARPKRIFFCNTTEENHYISPRLVNLNIPHCFFHLYWHDKKKKRERGGEELTFFGGGALTMGRSLKRSGGAIPSLAMSLIKVPIFCTCHQAKNEKMVW